MSKDIEDMLAVNAAQKQYYEFASGSSESRVNSPLTNAWRRLRTRALASGKKVLELGVGGGSPLSEMLAGTAAEYVALDLSRRRLRQLRKRLKRAGICGRP